MSEIIGDAQAIIDAARMLGDVELIRLGECNGDDVLAASVPSGRKLESIKPLLDQYIERPERKRGTAYLTTLDSLIDYVNRHKAYGDAVVYVDDRERSAPVIRAVINAHGKALEAPDWQDFCAVYPFPLSDEWKVWASLKKEFSQAEFAAFLEDRITDVCEPGPGAEAFARDIGVQLASAARLMELSRGLSINVGGKVAQVVNLGTGECTLSFSEEHKDTAGAPLKVPGAFAIGIPVFRLGVLYQLPVRLRYRVSGASVLWSLTVQRADKAFELAIDEAAKLVAEKTALPVFRGGL